MIDFRTVKIGDKLRIVGAFADPMTESVPYELAEAVIQAARDLVQESHG